MTMISPSLDIVAELRQRVEHWGGIEWIADRADPGAIVVVFRRRAHGSSGRAEGVRIASGVGFTTMSAADRERLLVDAVVEIVDPAGFAVRLAVPWADGLVPDPESVLWKGAAIAQSARYALGMIGTSSQGCDGTPL